MVTTIQRSALVMHSAEEMFELVNDVEAYPQYMDGCQNAEVLERTGDEMLARLDLRSRGVKCTFTTRNQLIPFEEVRMQLHSGPFRKLNGLWTFKPLSESACKVSLNLDFEINNRLLNVAASSLFAKVANNLVAALTARADVVYGKAS